MRAHLALARVIDPQRGHLFPWLAVALAVGIALFFSLKHEPVAWEWAVVGAGLIISTAAAWRVPEAAPVFVAMAAICAGALLAGLRTQQVAGPVLEFRYYGPVQGRVVSIDRSASDKPRVTLDKVVLKRMDPSRTPRRVRVSLHGQQGFVEIAPGQILILTAHLSAPNGPAEPGGFDFQRHAWFQSLGAVGYTRTPALLLEPAQGRALFIQRTRMQISARVQAVVPGRAGAFAAAITTGDRSAMDLATLQDLRASNLAHLLAISGLHMGLLTGFVFAALRVALVLVPGLGLRWPVKKIAAIGALLAGAMYLALSGGNVATERAFVMVSVMFLAVILGRQAITLRAIALAAIIVLCLRPEALLSPGFQMSFAATTALVAVFQTMRDWPKERGPPRWLRPVIGVAVSSFVAGAATAPIAAAHFNQIPHYGLLANIVSVPLMGVCIIPLAVLAAVLAPFGAEVLALSLMAPPIDWILWVAGEVAGLPGSLSLIHAPPPAALPVLALGGLWLVLWQYRWRMAGLLAVPLAVWLWGSSDRPDVLVSQTAGLLGIMTDEGRALSKARGEGFAASIWLENDGDGADQAQAFARGRTSGDPGAQSMMLSGLSIGHVTGRGAADRAPAQCAKHDVLVVSAEIKINGSCTVIDKSGLEQSGAIAGYLRDGELDWVSALDHTGARLWNSSDLRQSRARQ